MKTEPTPSQAENERLLAQHAPLVKKIAQKMVKSLSANVECDDLIQDGMLGLIEAILKNSKDTTSAEFEHYVAQRAKGAMLDGLRAKDPASRQVRKNMRQVEGVLQQLGHTLGRRPQENEVAQAMGMPLAQYRRLLQEAHGYALISMDDLGNEDDLCNYLDQCADNSTDPLVMLERSALRIALGQAVKELPFQDRQLLSLYYEEGLKMHEIGKSMALSESRISQLHTQAIAQLRASFTDQAHETVPVLQPRRKQREMA